MTSARSSARSSAYYSPGAPQPSRVEDGPGGKPAVHVVTATPGAAGTRLLCSCGYAFGPSTGSAMGLWSDALARRLSHAHVAFPAMSTERLVDMLAEHSAFAQRYEEVGAWRREHPSPPTGPPSAPAPPRGAHPGSDGPVGGTTCVHCAEPIEPCDWDDGCWVHSIDRQHGCRWGQGHARPDEELPSVALAVETEEWS